MKTLTLLAGLLMAVGATPVALGQSDRATATAPAPAPATAPASAVTRPVNAEVRQIVADLSHDEWAVRQKAEDRLAGLGPDAAPLLEELARGAADDEVRSRLEAALARIAANDRTSPTLVSLDLDDVPAEEAVRQLSARAGATIAGWPDHVWRNAQPVTMKVERQPFWLALRELCGQAGLHPQFVGTHVNAITLVRQGGEATWANKPYALHQCFFVVAEGAGRTHNVDFGVPDRVDASFNLNVTVYVDPKVKVYRGTRTLALDEVVDEHGNSLIPDAPLPASAYDLEAHPFGAQWVWQHPTALRWTPQMGKRMTVRGRARFLVESQSERWEVEDVMAAAGKQREFAGVTYRIESVRSTGAGYQLNVALEYPRGLTPDRVPLSDHRLISHSVQVLDEDGNAFHNVGGSSAGTPGKFTSSIHVQPRRAGGGGNPAGKPARLVWTIPTDSRLIEVPVEFKDLPIP